VFAATTSTGNWSVFAVERAYVRDDGSAAGGASRSLALVNASANDGGPQVIDIGLSQKSGGVEADWHRVSWSGTTLAAGRRAADLALGCLR
jgi:hypothetical protein